MAYRLRIKNGVYKDLRKLPNHVVERATSRIEALPDEPIPQAAIKLKGTLQTYRIRIGDYRLVYEVDHSEEAITVSYVRHRKEIYRGL